MSQKEAPRLGLVRAAVEGRITNAEGARTLELSVRQFRRLRAAFRELGVGGLLHANRGRPSPRRLSDEERQRVVDLINQRYVGFNDCHLTQKLWEHEGLRLSRETVRRIRVAAGLPAKRRRRAPKHRKRRPRAEREGALVLIDGSHHDWLEGRGPIFTLIGAIDDASGRLLALSVRHEEDLHGYLDLLGQVLRQYGLPLALYGDRFGALVRTDSHWSLEEQLAGRQHPTQFGRVLEELGIRFIVARSPQGKGRVERLWNTLQDRLVSELRLRGLRTVEQVVAYLPEFITEHNRRFAVPTGDAAGAWRRAPRDLDRLLACRYTRKVARDNTVTLPGRWLQLPARARGRSWQGCTVEVRECLDGRALVLHGSTVIARQAAPTTPFTLLHREGGHARRRCPENFSPVPRLAPEPPPRRARPPRPESFTRHRKPAREHPWQRAFKPPTCPPG